MPSPIFIDATDLVTWANRRDAQSRLPQMVRRLILATTEPDKIEFRSGEGVQLGGWDGIVTTQVGNSFVPKGISAWEMGTSTDPKTKAEDDYIKRSNACGKRSEVEPLQTTFVFVTPRRWSGKNDWASNKRDEGVFKDVRVYDADDIETWLEQSPAVHLWISELAGKGGGGVQSLDSYWVAWSTATAPPFSPALVICGRDDAVLAITERLMATPAVIPIHADSSDEALVFLAAAIRELPEAEAESLVARSVVVDDRATWARLIAFESPLIVVPTFESANVGPAIQNGHHVVVPFGREAIASSQAVVLPRPIRAAAKVALMSQGISDRRADKLAGIARRSLRSLRRTIAHSPEIQQPEWAFPEHAHSLVPILFAGQWDETRQADKDVVASLAAQSYEQVETTLIRWANSSDPPIRRVGSTWYVVAKEDAWTLLSQFLTSQHFGRFREATINVLGMSDPSLDLAPDRRWAAEIYGKAPTHSSVLRTGIAESLALMGSSGGRWRSPTGRSLPEVSQGIVQQLLSAANQDSSLKLWPSLADQLPLLAEAAPDVFVNNLEAAISAEPSNWIRVMFTDAKNASSFFASSPHTGLLWALENLAWSPPHLSRATLLLARLSRLDPGGSLSNRPLSSLVQMFLLWYPQASATLDGRFDILDLIRDREPAVAWPLLIAILPGVTNHGHPIHSPSWRDWVPDSEHRVTHAELSRGVKQLAERLLVDVGAIGSRWATLIANLHDFPESSQNDIIQALVAVDVARFDADGHDVVWCALRELLHRHRRYAKSDWALPRQQLDMLDDAYHRFTPSDVMQQYAWLFSMRPDLPDVDDGDWPKYRDALDSSRRSAVSRVLTDGGMHGIQSLAGRSEEPWLVGQIVGFEHLKGDCNEHEMFTMLDSEDFQERALAMGYIDGRFKSDDWDWAEAVLNGESDRWTVVQQASFLLSLPSLSHTWDWAERLGDATEHEYWTRQSYWINEPENYAYAVLRLARHGRPRTAIRTLALHLKHSTAVLPVGDIADILDQAISMPHDSADSILDIHDIGEVFDYLEQRSELDETRLAQLEWIYLPLLNKCSHSATVLHKALAESPAFFVEVIGLLYRSDHENQRETDDQSRFHAERAYDLLASWKRTPGVYENGGIDEKALMSWIETARALLSESGHSAIGDEHIGKVLRYAQTVPEEAWPPEVVRNVLESIASPEVELGLLVEVRNSRGLTSRGLTEGGTQERGLAAKYRSLADVFSIRWPRTSTVMRALADQYEYDASGEDTRAELTEDFW